MAQNTEVTKFGYGGRLLAARLLTAATLVNSQDERKIETIDATAMGTSTQFGCAASHEQLYETPQCFNGPE